MGHWAGDTSLLYSTTGGCLKSLYQLFLLLVSVLSAAPFAFAEDFPLRNWGRGPFEIEDPFPLALLHSHFLAQSPEVGEQGLASIEASFMWTNTSNSRGGSYRIDAETRVLRLQGSYVLFENFELSLSLPIVWRGGGILDSPIYEWHEFFGMSQGARPAFPRRGFELQGRNDDGSRFSIARQGTAFGDASVGFKHLLYDKEYAWSMMGDLRLPTGADDYGQDATDLTVGTLFSRRFDSFVAYLGGGYLFYGDENTSGVEFRQNRFAGFLTGEYEAFQAWSFILTLDLHSGLLKSVPDFPDYQFYIDVGAKVDVQETTTLEFALRENLGHQDSTADVAFFFSIRKDIGVL